LLYGSLLAFALVLNREGDRVPSANEFIYMLYFWKAWHPAFLATDWTFQETTAGHAIFNYAFGWMTLLMPLVTAAWIGRVVCWVATFIGLFRVGRHYKLQDWAVWLGILLWLLQRQSPVTGEWLIGTFEAKTIAYPALVFAIDAALSERFLIGGILCGIAFSFHTAIGMWGGAALGFAVLTHSSVRKTIEFSIATLVFSLPGLLTSLSLITGPHAITEQQAKFLTTISLPDCNDSAQFPHTWVVLLFILPVFAWMHSRWRKDDRQVSQLMVFQFALACFFAFGVIGRFTGHFKWVELYPMRVYGGLALLLFFWQAISVLISCVQRKPTPALLWIFGLLLFLSMPSPVLQLRDMVATRLQKYLHPPKHDANAWALGDITDFKKAAQWISDPNHTDKNDLVIAPPWWNPGFYWLWRPQIVSGHAPRYDAMTEWKERIEALVGDTSDLTYEDAEGGVMNAAAWLHYATLTPEQINDIQKKYGTFHGQNGAKWLVTTGKYPYPVAFRTNTYVVYRLPPMVR
jgi:hypothetical protein